MSKTTRSSSQSTTRPSNHTYDNDDHDQANYDEMSDDISGSSSNEDDIATPRPVKSKKIQPTDAADYEEGGMYDRGGRRRKRKGSRRGRSKSKRRRSRSRRRR